MLALTIIDVLDKAWQPATEILILAVGLYYVFTFVRGTRGAAIVTGFMVVLLTLAFVANFLDLIVLRWLLGSITTFFVIAVLVIFQPEIRRMLAQLGNLEAFGNVQEQREAIEVIIQTVERLADVHIGALRKKLRSACAVASGVGADVKRSFACFIDSVFGHAIDIFGGPFGLRGGFDLFGLVRRIHRETRLQSSIFM